MNGKKLVFTLLVICVAFTGVEAQKLKKAKRQMEFLNYVGAIEIYNQILEKDDVAEAKINIAECYRKISDSENAEYWYGQVVRLPEAEPIHNLFYGQSLQRNGKCDLAKEWYEKYISAVPDDMRGQYLVEACDYEDELMTKNSGIFDIQHPDFNSNLDDFTPVYFNDGLVFASERDKGTAVKRRHSWTGNPFLELYYIEAKQEDGENCGNYEYGSPEKFSGKKLNTKFHDAAVTFSSDESQIFFTRNNITDGKVGKSDDNIVKLKVFSASNTGGSNWGNLEGLPFNSDEYSVAHPTLTPDGTKLYFASDMPGGFGSMDLYVSERESGRWGPPMNLGPAINTEGNEIFPYYHESERLYFSSDGQIGLGGLDLYYMDDKGEGQWGEVVNMGYPLNSISDDFGIAMNEEGTCGHFSSDRDGGAGRDDIYSFRKTASPVEILVYDKETKEPIEGATVVNDCTGNTLTTDAEGKVKIDMKMNECCNFAASMEGYLENAEEGCTKDISIGDPVFVEIPLEPETKFELEGVVFDMNTGLPLPGALVELTNDCEDAVQTVVADSTGAFSFPLIEDCCYTVKGSKEDYLAASVKDQCTRDLVEATTLQTTINLMPITVGDEVVGNPDPFNDATDLVDPNDPNNPGKIYDPNDPTTNGRGSDDWTRGPGTKEIGEPYTYLVHIYYDFDQSYIREEDYGELEKLLLVLDDNPEYVVEIGSHTDSRGSFAYNKSLSQRRAESVVRWLTENGVSRERLVPLGYGENENVNDCANRIPCSEEKHQMNRRTEFKVLGKIGEYDPEEVSLPQNNPRVDACQGCPFQTLIQFNKKKPVWIYFRTGFFYQNRNRNRNRNRNVSGRRQSYQIEIEISLSSRNKKLNFNSIFHNNGIHSTSP